MNANAARATRAKVMQSVNENLVPIPPKEALRARSGWLTLGTLVGHALVARDPVPVPVRLPPVRGKGVPSRQGMAVLEEELPHTNGRGDLIGTRGEALHELRGAP